MDMPLSLKELWRRTDRENLDTLEAYLIDSPYVEQSEKSYKASSRGAMEANDLVKRKEVLDMKVGIYWTWNYGKTDEQEPGESRS